MLFLLYHIHSNVLICFNFIGTSLPDTFASRTAAVNEKSADNSIGNVTGSNGVNVFLGLGVPWLIASIYWTAQVSHAHACTMLLVSV